MTSVKAIYDYISSIAPYDTQMNWDNSGLNVGDMKAPVSTALLALDLTDAVISRAEEAGAQLIITHHPSIFHSIKNIYPDLTAYRLIRSGIAAISAHTNLDAASGGVNDVLCETLSLANVTAFSVEGEAQPLARIGTLPCPMSASSLAEYVRARINAGKVSFVDCGKEISRVAVIGGSGGEYCDVCRAAGAQALITGEAKHHHYLSAADSGITLIVAGHYETESPVIPALRDKLAAAFPEVSFILSDADHIIHYC